MIFTLIPATETHRVILHFPDSDKCWEAFDVLAAAYPYYLQPNVVCYGGYESSLEMFCDFPAQVYFL